MTVEKPKMTIDEINNLIKFRDKMTDKFIKNATALISDVNDCLKDIKEFHDKNLNPSPTDALQLLLSAMSYLHEFTELGGRIRMLSEVLDDASFLLNEKENKSA